MKLFLEESQYKKLDLNPIHCKTRDGTLAIVFSTFLGATELTTEVKTLLGAYYTGEEWIPCSWYSDGLFMNSGSHRAVDLILEIGELEAA